MHFNAAELAIILVIVLVLFGGGRIGKMGGELGTALREFRRGLSGDDDKVKVDSKTDTATHPVVSSLPEPVVPPTVTTPTMPQKDEQTERML